jgi:replicative DNA helicase
MDGLIVDNLKIPPYSLEAEQSIIGSLLVNYQKYDEVGGLITADDFYNLSHKIIYTTISYLCSNSKIVDLITVSDYLESKDKLEQAGGFAYLGEMAKNTPSSANITGYADIVKNKSTLRKLISTSNEIADRAYNPLGDTSAMLLADAYGKISALANTEIAKRRETDAKSICEELINEAEELIQRKTDLIGIDTSITELNKRTGGFQKEKFILIGGRPAMGKTTFALNCIEQEILTGGYPLIFSIEMPATDIIKKLVSSIGLIDMNRMSDPKLLEDDDWARYSNAIDIIKRSNLHIIDNQTLSPDDARIMIRRYEKDVGAPTVIMFDYIQLMNSGGAENRTQEISTISRALNGFKKEFKCPILALTQLNRGLESRSNKRPINSDLRESGQLEQDADMIIFLYRDEVYNENTDQKGLAEILITKGRMCKVGRIGAVFDGAKSKFKNWTGEMWEEEKEDQSRFN